MIQGPLPIARDVAQTAMKAWLLGPGCFRDQVPGDSLEGPNRIMHQQPKHIDGECMLGEKKKHLQNNGHALIEDRYKKQKQKTAAASARTSNCCRTLCCSKA